MKVLQSIAGSTDGAEVDNYVVTSIGPPALPAACSDWWRRSTRPSSTWGSRQWAPWHRRWRRRSRRPIRLTQYPVQKAAAVPPIPFIEGSAVG